MRIPHRSPVAGALLLTATLTNAMSLIHAGSVIDGRADRGVALHGDNAKKFIYMVWAGLPAIQSATLERARLLREGAKGLGTAESGKFSELVAVPGVPPAEISLMTKVSFVMKAGKVYEP